MRGSTGLISLACLGVLTACDGRGGACVAGRPSLEACAYGRFFADCGGTDVGRSVLGCRDDGSDCKWFADGCVAREYHASDCPAEDACCVETSSGRWPFRDWAPTYTDELRSDLTVIAGAPISRTSPASIDVTIDPSWRSEDPLRVTCSGSVDTTVCELPSFTYPPSVTVLSAAVLLRFEVSPLGRWHLLVEIVPQDDGPPIARVYETYLADVTGDMARSCTGTRGRLWSGPGALVLTNVPTQSGATVHGRLDIALDEGRVELQF